MIFSQYFIIILNPVYRNRSQDLKKHECSLRWEKKTTDVADTDKNGFIRYRPGLLQQWPISNALNQAREDPFEPMCTVIFWIAFGFLCANQCVPGSTLDCILLSPVISWSDTVYPFEQGKPFFFETTGNIVFFELKVNKNFAFTKARKGIASFLLKVVEEKNGLIW